MRLSAALPSQEYLRECFDYDPKTGILTWRARPEKHFGKWRKVWLMWNAQNPGHEAGKIRSTDGYRSICLGGRYYRTARIIFKLMTGREPHSIDHRDRNPLNNSWKNLRPATEAQNHVNVGARRHNKLGIKGVQQLPNGSYRAKITVNKKTIHLGVFDTAEEAHVAYCEMAQATWGEFAAGH